MLLEKCSLKRQKEEEAVKTLALRPWDGSVSGALPLPEPLPLVPHLPAELRATSDLEALTKTALGFLLSEECKAELFLNRPFKYA